MIAVGVQTIKHHSCKVRFFSIMELVNALEKENAMGKAGKTAEMLTKIDLVTVAVRAAGMPEPPGHHFYGQK